MLFNLGLKSCSWIPFELQNEIRFDDETNRSLSYYNLMKQKTKMKKQKTR